MSTLADRLRAKVTAGSTDFDLESLADEAERGGYNRSHAMAYLVAQRRLLKQSPSMRHQGRQK